MKERGEGLPGIHTYIYTFVLAERNKPSHVLVGKKKGCVVVVVKILLG